MRRKKTAASARVCSCHGQYIKGSVPQPAVYPSYHSAVTQLAAHELNGTSANTCVPAGGGL